MNDYIDHCLDEGLPTLSEYFGLIEAGEDDFASDPELCVHEAGHAVVAYVVRRPIEYVSAEEWDEDAGIPNRYGGITYFGTPGGVISYAEVFDRPLTELETAARMYREMMTALAGGYAAHRYTGCASETEMSKGDRDCFASAFYSFCHLNREVVKPPFAIPMDPSDWARKAFERWCEANKPDTNQRDLWSEVAHIIDGHWHLVEGLAAVLMRQPWLTGQEIYEVFERIEARRAAAA
jgi:hypothetical protein